MPEAANTCFYLQGSFNKTTNCKKIPYKQWAKIKFKPKFSILNQK